MKKIGLFFGSFNPIHVGHLIIADFMANNTSLDEIWLVVSPQNPLKKKSTLLPEYDRLHLVKIAIEGNSKLRASDIEFKLPKPSYTIDTLAYLEEKFPEKDFTLIMGGDNLVTIHKWKNAEVLLKRYPIFVYKRPSYPIPDNVVGDIHFFDAPLLNISSTFIRSAIKNKQSIRYLVLDKVAKEITEMHYYENQ